MSTEEKPKIKISDVLDLLAAGQDRKAIRAHYGLTAGQTLALFKHPQLLGRKVIKPVELPFELEDDVTGTARALKHDAKGGEAKDNAALEAGDQAGKPEEGQEQAAATTSTRRARASETAESVPAEEMPAQERSPWDDAEQQS